MSAMTRGMAWGHWVFLKSTHRLGQLFLLDVLTHNLPLSPHLTPPIHQPASLYVCGTCDITGGVQKSIKTQQIHIQTLHSYVLSSIKTIPARIFQIGILQNPKCDNLVGFPKPSHI